MRYLNAALLCMALFGTAKAATVLDLSIPELADRSSLIFTGRVVAQQSRSLTTAPLQIVTDTAIHIDQLIKGERTDRELTLTQAGGTLAGTIQTVPGYPVFAVGERVLLFIEETDTDRQVVAGLAQGKYTLVDDPKTGGVVAVGDTSGLHRVGRRLRPDRVFAGVPGSEARVPLSQMLGLIQGFDPEPMPARVIQRSRLGGTIRRLKPPAPPSTPTSDKEVAP